MADEKVVNTTPKNEVIAKPKLSLETASYEQLIASNTAQTLQKQLHLNEAQIAKANLSLMSLMDDDKLKGATNVSKMRFVYKVATYNYKHPNAIAPVKYGTSIMAQPQYQAYIEDMVESGFVEETNALPIYKGIDYQPKVNKWGYKELQIQEIKLDDPFKQLEVAGYYAYAKCKDGRVITCLMSNEELDNWAKRYSISQRAYLKGDAKSSIWNSDKDKMSLKTVSKAVARDVLKYFPYDRLAKLIEIDQQVFTETGTSYADNPQVVDVKPSGTINNVEEAVKVE